MVDNVIDDFKEAVKEETIKKHELTPDEIDQVREMLELAKLPVVFTNDDFTMGERELDIRELNKKNRDQLMFRMSAVLPNVYLRQILTSLIDMTRLLMLLCKKNGVVNINEELDDLIKELNEQMAKGIN